MTPRDFVASRSVIPKNPSLTRKPNPCTSPMAHLKFPRNGVQKIPMTCQRASPSIGKKQNNLRLCFAEITIIFIVTLCDTR
jgi:hypothetical protein